jgi:hypothetical protein
MMDFTMSPPVPTPSYRTNYIESFHDGGSNVTFLTGIFQKLLPDVERSIRTIAQKAIAQASWTGDMSQLGIRSVQHLSFYKPGLKAHRQEKKLQHLKNEDNQPAFVIHPSHESIVDRAKKAEIQKRMQVDPDADEVVSGYLQQADPGVPQYPRFSAEATTISRYTPELGSMLLGQGEYSRGLRPVLFGRRNSLVLEFWAYEDAPVGAKRPSLLEAKPRRAEGFAQGEL